MIGTFLGAVAALFLFYNPDLTKDYINLNALAPIFFGIAIILLFLETLSLALAWSPLQKASKQISPHLLNLYNKDRKFHFAKVWFFLFTLATLFLSFNISILHSLNENVLIGIWIFLFGFSFDCLQYIINRTLNFLNPFAVLDSFKKEGIINIQDEHEIDLCNQYDAISEVAVKGINTSSPYLANHALDNIQSMTKIFLESSKSIGHTTTDSQTKALGIQDKVSFTLSYLFQRIDFVFQNALDKKLEVVLNSLITTMGKICIYASNYDLTLLVQPVIHLGKYATKSLENKFQDVAVRATLTLVEIAREIVSEIDLSYLEIQEPFLSLIGQLENIAKETLKQDKTSNIKILIQPFLDLKELFKSEKAANHQDIAVINQDLDRIIAEFQIYETVMRTIPPLPTT